MKIYYPKENNFILLKEVKGYVKSYDNVLDIGTGTGILAKAASSKAKLVIATDINKDVIRYCKKTIKSKNIKFIHFDLFNNIPKIKFDIIIFNPPYLPADKFGDESTNGGKYGFEILERFLKKLGNI